VNFDKLFHLPDAVAQSIVEKTDLCGGSILAESPALGSFKDAFPSSPTTEDDFKIAFPDVVVAFPVCGGVSGLIVQAGDVFQVFLSASSTTTVSCTSPFLMYGAGTWIIDNGKA